MDFESSSHLDIHSSEEDISLISEVLNNSSTISNSSSTSDFIGSNNTTTSSSSSSNEVFEIRDFSTLSSWEKLIDKFEQLILAWFNRFSNFQFTPTETFFYKSHIIQFNGTRYLFSYYNFNNNNDHKNNNTDHDNNVDSNNVEQDFLHRSHHLTRWFGVREFFIISLYNNNNKPSPSSSSPSSSFNRNNSNNNNSTNISIQSSTSLSSALSVSLSNLNKNDIPYFILLNNEYLNYNGRLNSKNNQITKYKSEALHEKQLNSKYITSSLMKLSGMIDLFCINLGKHIRITNELTIKSRYTFILPYLNSKEWLKIKDDFNFTKSERNLLFTIGTKQDPIKNFHFSCIFNSININEPNIDDLNIKNAHLWELKFNQLKLNEFELSSKLKLFINNIILNDNSSINNPLSINGNNYINEIIYDIFEITTDETFQIKSKLLNEKQDVKSCQPNSLLRRFCDHILRIKSKQDLKLLWKLFIKVLFKYWEESNINELINEFPLNTSFIPFTNSNVNWSTCLLEQKIDMLNICCLKQIEILKLNDHKKKKKNEDVNTNNTNDNNSNIDNNNDKKDENDEDDEEWKDSGFEILSDQSEDEEYFEIDEENDENLERIENVIKIIEISPGKEIKIPKTQNPPQNTEDVIEEEREILSNMISSDQRIRFQCEGLISDMQAFKFVNPGCEFSDFLLWYSPKDVQDFDLSSRMKMNENIWKKFWEESKPLPISKQKQIFDHKLQAEKIIHQIETMDFDVILQQLMICTLTGHYYVLKEWWIDLIMDSTDIFSNEFEKVDKKIDSNLPLIRIIEKKFIKTRDDLKILSNRLQDNNLILQCVENIQDLEESISIILSIISKITIQGKKSFMEIYNTSKFLLISIENLIINSQDYIQFNITNNNNTSNGSSDSTDNNIESINASICEFINDQLETLSNNSSSNNNIERVSEFILRCTAQRPYLISQPTQQLMYALISRDEIRVSTALTEKVPW